MDSTVKNIAIVLLLLTFAFIGYYLFIQKDQTELSISGADVSQELFTNVQKYVERRTVLDKVKLDLGILSDNRFRGLVSYTTPIVEQPIGRENPFDKINPAQVNRSTNTF